MAFMFLKKLLILVEISYRIFLEAERQFLGQSRHWLPVSNIY
jgi:hypothetical protein